MPKIISALLVAAIFASSFPAAAQDVTTLPVIVVTPARSPMPINQVASSMTVIERDEIERQHKATVIEILRQVPGLSVAGNGGIGQPTRLFMRGTNSNHVLVLVDGVAVNDPSDPGDAFDFSNLTTGHVERIEVLRGPQSTLYGSQALGGVINIITRTGTPLRRADAFAEYGRYDSRRAGIGASSEVGRLSYSFHSSYGHTDGISSFDRKFGGREKDGNDTYTFAANLAASIGENFTARLNTRYNRTNTEFDSLGGFTRPADDPLPVNDSRQWNGRASGELLFMDGKWTQELGVNYLNLDRAQITEYFDSMFNVYFGRQQYVGWRESADWVHRVQLAPGNKLTFGVEARSDHYKLYSIPAVALPEVNADSRAVFIDDQIAIGENLFMGMGARVDDHQAFGRYYTWKIAPGYRIRATNTRLKATYGTGFKAPSLAQLYDPATGNASLQPEESRGWDAGFEQTILGGRATFGATWFRNNITNLIGFDNTPPFPTINVGKARTQGVESSIAFHPSDEWSFAASHSFIQADDQSGDKRLARRPRHQAHLSAIYRRGAAWDMGMSLRYVSKSSDIDFNFPFGRVYVKPFATVDLVANYRLTSTATIYGRLDNLLDKRYEEVFGYGMPGMSLTLGVKGGF